MPLSALEGKNHPIVKMNKGTEIAVLASGGLDSSILLYDLSRPHTKVYPLYIKSGLFWERVELYWLRRFLKAIRLLSSVPVDSRWKGRHDLGANFIQRLTILKLPMHDLYDGHWSLTGHNVPDYAASNPSVYLPGRNLVLLSKASLFCAMNHIGTLALGPLKGNPFKDSSRTFFKLFQRSASQALDTRITITAPYLDLSKNEVIRRGRLLPLELTFSCIRPVGRYHCGMCNKCAERQQAFKKAGIADKTIYKGQWSHKP